MLFEYTRRRGARSPITDAATFKVGRLKRTMSQEAKSHEAMGREIDTIDLSHLIDTSYNYHSPRELRWHLAERFGMAPEAVALREHA
ncbi:AsnC family transcriptional regulator [Methylobacterium sp. J-068]|uniref:AsnC family transcriptional regulator n=1 Tax=Methylobacterium sp. J-068 TaxID=2836649 RepID=UPI001FB9065D|nr:AsnC family transcriptional regulator [Methylobacterium sp. J-068]MCJ2033903.1 AsnC family transcriptional regulator [Methylobacterium sp. J-068]